MIEKTAAHFKAQAEYADLIQSLSDQILASELIPVGIFIHLHFSDGSVRRVSHKAHSLNLLNAIGAFSCAQAELTNEVIKGP